MNTNPDTPLEDYTKFKMPQASSVSQCIQLGKGLYMVYMYGTKFNLKYFNMSSSTYKYKAKFQDNVFKFKTHYQCKKILEHWVGN